MTSLSWRLMVLVLLGCAPAEAQDDETRVALAVFDQVLDTRVRDGFVYYRALKADRRGLDRYVASLATADVPRRRDDEIAFWLNAYNGLVLQTVVNHYPGRTMAQIPAAFTRRHQVAGRALSLEQIEQTILAGYRDPRVFFALGRGAAGSGRLRSEIYTAEALDRQLREQMEECAARDRCIRVNAPLGRIQASQIFQWRRKEFADAYGAAAGARPALEKAVLAYAGTRPIQAEREFLERDRFRVEFVPFDWSLNDLATRRR